MENKPRLYFRTDEEKKVNFQMYALRHRSSVQEILEQYVTVLLELDISPAEALDAIRAAKEKPGE